MFGPELTLCGTIVLLLLSRLILGDRLSSTLVAFAGTVVALIFALFSWNEIAGTSQEAFTGMLVVDTFTVFFRIFLMAFGVLFVIFTWRSGIPDKEDAADFYTLALGSLLGMCLMVSANHLLIVFLAVEMASVPSYVLAGILKGRRKSSEAALKFAVYGAGAAGIMLYGISLIAGIVGTVHLPSAGQSLANIMANDPSGGVLWVLGLGGLMIMVGLAFKLSAVPFHFWAPDVFEGAAAEIGGFLSVASKAAAIGLLVRMAVGFGYAEEPQHAEPVAQQAASQQALADQSPGTNAAAANPEDGVFVSTNSAQDGAQQPSDNEQENTSEQTPANDGAEDDGAAAEAPSEDAAHTADSLAPVRTYISYLVGLLAAITCTFGNMAAYGQTNIKRLLAYSTIAHAGYMMFAVAGALPLIGTSTSNAEYHIASLAFYVVTYLFMNLTAFAIVAFMRNRTGSEEISDYAGLIRTSPGLVVCFSIILMSLIGLPPLAGFAAKYVVFSTLAESGLMLLLMIGAINTVISLFYYLRVVKAMCLEEPAEGQQPVTFPIWKSVDGWFVLVLTLPVVVFGVFWGPLHDWALAACRDLLP